MLATLGRYADAVDEARTALELAHAAAPTLAAMVHTTLAEIASGTGDVAGAVDHLAVVRDLCAATGHRQGEAVAVFSSARLAYLAADADSCFAEVTARCEAAGLWHVALGMTWRRADVMVRRAVAATGAERRAFAHPALAAEYIDHLAGAVPLHAEGAMALERGELMSRPEPPVAEPEARPGRCAGQPSRGKSSSTSPARFARRYAAP